MLLKTGTHFSMGLLTQRGRRLQSREAAAPHAGSGEEGCCSVCADCSDGGVHHATAGAGPPPVQIGAARSRSAGAPMAFDLAIVGAGSAGLSVAAVAAQLGVRVALIERGRMGGDCLNTGCVPSKALLAAAHAARGVRESARFGVIALDPIIDWDRLRAHVQGVIAEIAPAD